MMEDIQTLQAEIRRLQGELDALQSRYQRMSYRLVDHLRRFGQSFPLFNLLASWSLRALWKMGHWAAIPYAIAHLPRFRWTQSVPLVVVIDCKRTPQSTWVLEAHAKIQKRNPGAKILWWVPEPIPGVESVRYRLPSELDWIRRWASHAIYLRPSDVDTRFFA